MAALAKWRDKVPAALLIAGLISLLVGAGMYLIYSQLDRPTLVFLVLGAGLLVLYVVEDIENVAHALTGRGARYGGNTVAMVAVFLAIVGLLNFLSVRHSLRWDLTAAREFSLSSQTVKILKSVDQPVKVTAFFQQGDYGRTEAEDLLKEYRRQNDKIEYEFVDWQARPGDAIKYKLQSFPVMVMESGGRRQDVTAFTEQDLTSGIFKVIQGEPKKVYFTVGHGEPAIDNMGETGIGLARQALEASNYKVDTINLATTPVISDDVAALVIYAPQTALLDQEKKAIQDYLDRGGKAMILVAAKRTANLADLVKPYGVDLGDGYAIDSQALVNQPYVPVITSYPDFSPITRDFQGTNQAVLLPMATQITVTQQLPAGVSAARLLQTTDRSWLATDEKDISYHQGDLRGPLTLAVAITADAKGAAQQGSAQPEATPTPAGEESQKAKTRLAVFGSADFASNLAIDAMSNRPLFVNTVNWLTEEEAVIGIRPEPPVDRTLMLTGAQANLLIYSSVLFLPLVVAGAGAWVWWSRR